MSIGTGFLNIGKIFVEVRANERLATNTVGSSVYYWNTDADGLYGKGPNGNHPNITESASGNQAHWMRLFKADSGNISLTKKACSGFAANFYKKLKNVDTKLLIETAQYDSGVNQYRFYNFIKRSQQNLFGVKDMVQDVNISEYEQEYGKSLTKYVQIDAYTFGIYDDQTKTTDLSGLYYAPSFCHSVAVEWYPNNLQNNFRENWYKVLSGISTESFYTKYSNPDANFNGFMPGETTYKQDPNAKHHYTWTSVNK